MAKNMTRLTEQQIENLSEWMTIPDFPKYEVNCRKGLVRNAKTLRVLKPSPNGNGYPHVKMRKDGKWHNKMVHRLVALAAFGFYNISTDGLFVCHLDETRTNSCIDNLALGTNKENLNFEKAKQRCSEAKSKRVGAYKDGVLTLIFNSLTNVNVYGFNMSAVCGCCRGRLKSHKGYEWRYFDTTTAMTV